eukprot:Pgem_evm1s6829
MSIIGMKHQNFGFWPTHKFYPMPSCLYCGDVDSSVDSACSSKVENLPESIKSTTVGKAYKLMMEEKMRN